MFRNDTQNERFFLKKETNIHLHIYIYI